MRRRPGDISPYSESGSGVRIYTPTSGSPIVQPRANTIFADSRPSYAKGSRSKFGSLLWIFPTGYKHFSREIKAPGSAVLRVQTNSGLYSVSESNPDLNSIITSYGHLPFNDMSGIEYVNARNAAKVKALNSISDNKAGLAEDFITYAQTVRMFSSKTRLLHGILDAFKHEKSLSKYLYRSAADVAKSGDRKAADLYLEYVYGWKPLVSDIYGIVQLLRQYSGGNKPVIIHGHGTFNSPGGGYFQAPPNANGFQTSASIKEDMKAKCDLYARIDPQYLAFRVLNQLGLLNPASIAWEVTPWSFVVDWLIPIGPTLSAFSAPVGLTFISGTISTRSSRVVTGEYHVRVATDPPTGNVLQDTPIQYTVTDEMYQRDILSTWPFPVPYLDLNPFRGDRSLKALALLIANLRR